MLSCETCGNLDGNFTFICREMMYGFGSEFEYIGCAACGGVQIAKIPADLSAYYPNDYYSFDPAAEEGALKRFLTRRRAIYLAGGSDLLGRLYSRVCPLPAHPAWLDGLDIERSASILDVGSGVGATLIQLSYLGFRDLTGIDPFIERDIRHRSGVAVLRRSLAEINGRYDLIMMHHSFEHMPDPASTLEQVRALLGIGGKVLIRVPVAGCFAHKKYGADWVQIDAPRHLHLQSERGMKALVEKSGFVVDRIVYDSTGFQFWGSEQVKRGLPLAGPDDDHMIAPRKSVFSDEELRAFEEEAARLNEAGDGDQACFYLRKR